MHITRSLRLLAEHDPHAIERERLAIAEHQRRTRLLDKIERASSRLDNLVRMKASGVPLRSKEIPDAAYRVEFYTAAAERAGLIRPRKDQN